MTYVKSFIPEFTTIAYSFAGIQLRRAGSRMLFSVATRGRFESWRLFLVAVAVCMFVRAASGFDHPLSPEAMREAYFFGQSSDRGKAADFLGRYLRIYSPESAIIFHGKDGDFFVGKVELRTPYQRILKKSFENSSGYTAQQAEKDGRAGGSAIEIWICLFFGDKQPSPSDLYSDEKGRVLDHREDFWKSYQFRVQQSETIEPNRIEAVPIYGRRGQGLSGAQVCLELDASKLANRKIQVIVTSPDGRPQTTEFALDELK